MDQRIVEILMYVIGEIQSRRIKVDEIDGISEELLDRGFSHRDVATAISLVADRMAGETKRTYVAAPCSVTSHRVLHDIERQYVSPDAYGYLIQMTHLGLLDTADTEEIIERCMMMNNLNVGMDEMKMVVASHLLEKDPRQSDSTFTASPARPWSEHVH